jgi:hypothetical protein
LQLCFVLNFLFSFFFLVWQFSKEGGKYSEEKKLKVVLISPPHSSFLLPSSGELKKDPCYDTSLLRDLGKDEIENIPQPHEVRGILYCC